MFRTSFVGFLIIVVATFSVSVKVAEAGFWSALWTAIAAIVTVALVILTGGAAFGILGVNLMTGSVSLGGIGAAIITTGVACGTGLICGGGAENPLAIIVSDAGSCSSDNGMRFYDTDPGSAHPDDQVALYRFTLQPNPAFLDYYLGIWLGSVRGFNVRDPMAPGFYDAGSSSSGRAYIELDSNTYANYLSDVINEATPLRIMRYGDVCLPSGVCQILDQSAPENTYAIYAAKVLREYPRVAAAGTNAPVFALSNKFLTAVQGAPAIFPYFDYAAYDRCKDDYGSSACRRVAGQWYRPGTVFAGPYRVGTLSGVACAAPTTPAAILAPASVGCNFATLSVTLSNADAYDILRDDVIIASNIPADETVYNDSGLADGTTYQYTAVPRKGAESGSSNTLPVTTTSCAMSPSATVTLKSAQCTSLTLDVATANADIYHVIRDGVPVATNVQASQTEFTDSGLNQAMTYRYVVRAVGSTGSADSSELSATTADCRPSCVFSANPNRIVRGETAQLVWSCERVDACTIDGSSVAAPSGAKSVAPMSNATYTLHCVNPDGSTTTQATVEVARPGLREVPP